MAHFVFRLPSRLRAGLFGALALILMLAAQTASAQWWRFGADSGQPLFSELLFNSVSALRVERSLQMSPEDLVGSKVTVRGRAEVGQGKIGRIEASLDDGVTWTPVPIGDLGLFAFEFAPEVEHAYRFRIRALSTSGQMSNEADHAFEFKVVRDDSRALARAAFERLLERYMARDRSGFMQLVSDRFVGNISALDSALSNDFRFFDSIRIVPTLGQSVKVPSPSGDRWTIQFSFTRQVRSVRSGQMLQDRAYSTVKLVREGDGYKRLELATPLIFGVSDPGEIATFATSQSAGPVLTVDQNGNASIGKGQKNYREGRFTQGGYGFSLPAGNAVWVGNSPPYLHQNFAFILEGSLLFLGNQADSVMEVPGVGSLDDVRLPLSFPGWGGGGFYVVPGRIYAVKGKDGSTVVFEHWSGSDLNYRIYDR
ncbi:MAG: hypothetical protein ACK5JI_03555 [Azonexus sp.]